jgi:superfamily II DNA/RNA helicase
MRNIARVVLWGLPPSFCGLVQRAGRTGRDFETLGEAILIVPASVIKNGTKEAKVEQAVQDAVTENQAENRGDEEHNSLEESGIEVASGNQEVLVNDGGVRVEHNDSEPEEETSGKTQRRRKLSKNDTNSLEARYLTMFACAARCLRVIWDEFFKNSTKCKWVLPTDYTDNNSRTPQCNLFTLRLHYTRLLQGHAAVTSAHQDCSHWRTLPLRSFRG